VWPTVLLALFVLAVVLFFVYGVQALAEAN
jgi:hypothetical protein